MTWHVHVYDEALRCKYAVKFARTGAISNNYILIQRCQIYVCKPDILISLKGPRIILIAICPLSSAISLLSLKINNTYLMMTVELPFLNFPRWRISIYLNASSSNPFFNLNNVYVVGLFITKI